MVIAKTKYAIVTKNFPLEFDDGNGNGVDNIEEARLYNDEKEADKVLQCFDEPEDHQIISVNVTYEF